MNKAMAQVVASGTTGDCTWELTGASGNYTLTISGNGAMRDNFFSPAPWDAYKDDIKTLDIQQGVTSIGMMAFSDCIGLTSLTIPNSVTTIGIGAFSGCSGLTGAVNISSLVTDIGAGAFGECSGLTDITVASGNLFYVSDGGVLFDNYKTLLIQYPAGKTGNTYTVPASVEDIGNGAFSSCTNLTTVTFAASSLLEAIEESAFESCTNLQSISFPASLTFIGGYAFADCGNLQSITFPPSLTFIGEMAFGDCRKLQFSSLPASLRTIGERAFTYCISLETITFAASSSLRTIGAHAFSACINLTSINLPASLTSMGDHAFYICTKLQSITIPKSLKSIDSMTFSLCQALETVTFASPSSLASIGEFAFNDCVSLQSISFPASLRTIGDRAFDYCISLETVTFASPSSLDSIGYHAFDNCAMQSISLPASLRIIGDDAFIRCKNLETVTFASPSSLTYIGWEAFCLCTKMPSITLPASVNSIRGGLVSLCSNLTEILVDENSPYLSSENGVLFNKNKTRIVAFPPGKTNISYVIPPSVNTVGTYCFPFLDSLKSITIPASVTILEYLAFTECIGFDLIVNWTTSGMIPTIRSRDSIFAGARDINVYIRSGTTKSNYTSKGWPAEFNYILCTDPEIIPSTSLTWTLCGGMLTIEGTGAIPNFTSAGNQPWEQYSDVITGVIIASGVTGIGDSAFAGCDSLETITISASTTVIGDDVFAGCGSLINIDVDAANLHYSSASGVLFNKAQDTLLQYPAGKTGNYVIPPSVTAIGNAAFAPCPGLTSVTIPRTVNAIDDRAFAGCAGLTDIYVNATDPPLLGADVFDNVSNGVSVHVPCNRVTDYQNAAGWDYFTNITGDVSFNLTLQNNNSAMGTAQIIQANTCANSVAIIEAIANTGYNFSQWNDGNTDNPRSITVTQDTTFAATFVVATQTRFHVTVTVNNGAMGRVTGEGDYVENTTATIEAIPNQGYRFVEWNDGNTQNPRRITVTQDITLTAIFEAATMYHVTLSVNDGSMGRVIGEGDYAENTTATIEAIPNQGYRFVEWNDGNTQNPRRITVTQDITFTANFEVGTGITEIATSTIAIYPNPAADHINIVLPEDATQAVFTLYDMQGKVLIRRAVNNQDAIKVSNLASGVYIYNIKTETQNYTSKLIRK
jgi:hypothetical protein